MENIPVSKTQIWLPATTKLVRTGAGVKGKRFIYLPSPGRIVDSHLTDYPPLPAQAHSSYKDKKVRAFVFSYPAILLDFGILGSCPFTF